MGYSVNQLKFELVIVVFLKLIIIIHTYNMFLVYIYTASACAGLLSFLFSRILEYNYIKMR